MKVVKVILLVILVIFVLLVIAGFLLSSDWAVSESVAIEAPASEVYPYVADFTRWPQWTSWAASDPDMQYTYSGAEQGAGQVVEWSGEPGTGRMEMTAVDSLRRVDYFFSMDDGTFGAESSIRLEERNGVTRVTWLSHGDVGANIAARYLMKVFTPYMSHDYRKGLERLKSVVEE